MSFSCVTNYLKEQMPHLLASFKNGECRFLALADAESTDDFGYPNSGYAPRTIPYLACSWSPKTNDKSNSQERAIADQTRASFVYQITVAQKENGAAVVCAPSDRLELRFAPGGAAQTLEIVSCVNQMNAAWLIYAIDVEE